MPDLESRFLSWLRRVCRDEHPGPLVIAYNIGLFETSTGYSAYLIGADRYSSVDGDWACAETFTPAERYFPIPAEGFEGWGQVHAAIVGVTRAFLRTAEGRDSFLARAKAVTVGFDDGDLERVN
jgi:hypothetical protein